MKNKCISYQVDHDNRIIFLSDTWQNFAENNDAAHLEPKLLLTKNIFEFVTDSQCREIYSMLLERARVQKKAVSFPFRCDSPTVRRYMQMEIVPLRNDLVQFNSFISREEIRDSVLLLAKSIGRSESSVTICSWCKKIKMNANHWVEVEDAIEKLDLFDAGLLPQLTHGICTPCYAGLAE